ncbi:hypothetical protein [Ornithinimicrobium kibberense]|uniref:hypothetical protein n=1 Tax=Ornithinimicrobium kibberense TaxID=282060 RepID=UPI003623941F
MGLGPDRRRVGRPAGARRGADPALRGRLGGGRRGALRRGEPGGGPHLGHRRRPGPVLDLPDDRCAADGAGVGRPAARRPLDRALRGVLAP